MRLVITQNITLDGVIEATEGWFEAGAPSEDHWALVREQMAAETGFLTGRRTFEDMRGFWPAQTDDETGITDHLNRVDKYVVSTTLTDPAWEPTTILRSVDELAALKASGEGELGATGSIRLCHALLTAGLVDELRLFVYPIVLGTGARLWPDGVRLPELEPLDTRRFASGVAYLAYRVA